MLKCSVLMRLAMINLLAHRLRTLLAALGLVIGTGAVVALTMSGELATRSITRRMEALGVNILTAHVYHVPKRSGQAQPGYGASMKQLLLKQTQSMDVAPMMSIFSPLKVKGQPVNAHVIGADESLLSLAQARMASGRFIAQLDGASRFCVIGADLYHKLQRLGILFPTGQHLSLGNDGCVVVGVLAPWEKSLFVPSDLNQAVILPLEAAHQIDDVAKVNSVVMRMPNTINLKTEQSKVEALIKSLFQGAQLRFSSPERLVNGVREQRRSLSYLLALIGGVSLLVGGIGVMNMMLVSVVERRREIGIRLALGAARRDIHQMFLIEAALLACVGGGAGVLLGSAGSAMIAAHAGWRFEWLADPIGLGLGVALLTGLFFGEFPARRAARLHPVQCLRDEIS